MLTFLYKSLKNISEYSGKKGFTLIELLVVVSIVGVLAAATVIILNPNELLEQARDAQRISDMSSISKAISVYQEQSASSSLGSPDIAYTSLVSTSTSCSNWSLPTLSGGYTYNCVTSPKLANGSGWIPINFTTIATGAPLPQLPVDPINNASHYYGYYVSGSEYEISSVLESTKYQSLMSSDGGNSSSDYEVGSDLALLPSVSKSVTVYLWGGGGAGGGWNLGAGGGGGAFVDSVLSPTDNSGVAITVGQGGQGSTGGSGYAAGGNGGGSGGCGGGGGGGGGSSAYGTSLIAAGGGGGAGNGGGIGNGASGTSGGTGGNDPSGCSGGGGGGATAGSGRTAGSGATAAVGTSGNGATYEGSYDSGGGGSAAGASGNGNNGSNSNGSGGAGSGGASGGSYGCSAGANGSGFDSGGGGGAAPLDVYGCVGGIPGAGGGGNTYSGPASGGNGEVMIAASTTAGISATGGTETVSGGNDIWTFTSNGTWTPSW